MSPTSISAQNWQDPFTNDLEIGAFINEQTKAHFKKHARPEVIKGFVQLRRPEQPNDKGATYLTHFKGLFLGPLNDIALCPAETFARLRAIDEQQQSIETKKQA